jgi:hypothetical protein
VEARRIGESAAARTSAAFSPVEKAVVEGKGHSPRAFTGVGMGLISQT